MSGAKDGTICFWDTSVLHPRTPRITLPPTILTFRFLPDSRSLLSLDTQGRLTRWSGTGFQDKATVLHIARNLEAADANSFSEYGNTIGSLNGHGTLHLWTAPSWEQISAAEAKEKAPTGQR